MSDAPVNLNRVRKQKARAAKTARADENAAIEEDLEAADAHHVVAEARDRAELAS